MWPHGRRLQNFFDADDGAIDEIPLPADVAPKSYPLHYETIHMNSDEDESEPLAHSAAEQSASQSDVVSLAQLRDDVEMCKHEVRRINLLLFRAAWKLAVATGPRRERPRASAPAPTDNRQRETRLSVRTRGEPAGALESLEGRGAVATRRQHGSSSLRDSSFVNILPSDGAHSTPGRVGGHPALVCHTRPFLPPTRHPTPPPLNSDEYAKFHESLFLAVADARRRGLLWQESPPPLRREAALAVSLFSAKAPTVRQRRAAGAVQMAPSAPAISLRQSALQKVASTQRVEVRAEGRGSASSEPIETKGTRWTPSLSVLILQVAKERALATLFLRQLRLDMYLRRARNDEVELRFRYYRQRSALREWRTCAKRASARRHDVLVGCVRWWVEYTRRRQRRHQELVRFRRQLHVRHTAFAQLAAAQKSRLFTHWKNAFTDRRVERSLEEVAASFRARRTNASAAPRLLCLTDPSIERLTHVTAAFVRARTLSRVLAHWRSRCQRLAEARLADTVYHTTLQLRVVVRLRRLIAPAAAQVTERRNAWKEAARQTIGVGKRVADTTSSVDRGPCRVIHISPLPLQTMRYKERSAARIGETRALLRAFGHWRHRTDNRRANGLRCAQLRVCVLRRWLTRLAAKRRDRDRLREWWQVWRERLQARSLHATATAYQRTVSLRTCFVGKWQRRCDARRVQRRGSALLCLHQWRERASLRAADRARLRQRGLSVFAHWRERTRVRVHLRTAVLVADTVHETILLLSTLRWWRERAVTVHQVRVSSVVLTELQAEKCLRSCFATWKRKAFGPYVPSRLPATFDVAKREHSRTSSQGRMSVIS